MEILESDPESDKEIKLSGHTRALYHLYCTSYKCKLKPKQGKKKSGDTPTQSIKHYNVEFLSVTHTFCGSHSLNDRYDSG